MDRTQASQLKKHLLKATDAINEATKIIFALSKEERATLVPHFTEISARLYFDLLDTVYFSYPDLRPPSTEVPTIISTLRWKDVALPRGVSESDLDSVIFSVLRPQWRKAAMVIGMSLQRCKELSLPVTDEMISARIMALSEAGRLEGAGDLRKWRHSEVRMNRPPLS